MPEKHEKDKAVIEETAKAEQFFKEEIVVMHGKAEYTFKIPTVKDRMKISGMAAKFRRDNDPDGNGLIYGYDPLAIMYGNSVAMFVTLLIQTSARWVYTPDEIGKPQINMDKWPDDAPVQEVIELFNTKLVEFREARHTD